MQTKVRGREGKRIIFIKLPFTSNNTTVFSLLKKELLKFVKKKKNGFMRFINNVILYR